METGTKDAGMKMETRRLADLRPAEYNPRITLTPEDPEFQKIKRSIETFGYVDPIIINNDGTIIGGHQRFNVLKDLGYTECQVVVLDLSKQDEKALNIALNKISGDWDEIKLKDLLLDLDITDYDLSVTGFEKDDLEDLVERLTIEPEAQDDDFDEESELADIKVPVTRRGDVWILGRHRLMCGDSTSEEDMETLMLGAEADLVITDPPYNVDYGEKTKFLESMGKGVTRPTIPGDHMDDKSFYSFLLRAFQTTSIFMRPGAAAYVFHPDVGGHIFRSAFIESGLRLSQCLIWEKNSLVLGRNDYQWIHEPILYGWKEGAKHYFINDRTKTTAFIEDDIDFKAMKKTDLVAYLEDLQTKYREYSTVIFEKKPLKQNLHPTAKPIALVGKLIQNSSKPGWSVLDPFGGSGSTLMAAEQLGRTAYTMEIDERFCDVVVRRWEEYTGKTAKRIDASEIGDIEGFMEARES